jgi:hypothetical protein
MVDQVHFTLYYYDQAGNLVRTVPPEGVHLLDASLQQQIWDARDKVVGTCTYNGPLSAANKDTLLGRLSAALQAGNTSAMECWLYNPAMDNNQLLATTSGNKYLFNTCINGLVAQIRQRQSHLPKGSTQHIIMDVRGQFVNKIQQMYFTSQVLTQMRTPGVTIEFKTN